MPIKRLQYPAENQSPSGDRGIDQRLSEAHVHGNYYELDSITPADLERWRKSLDVDLTTITAAGKAVIVNHILEYSSEAGGGFIQAPVSYDGTKRYAYTRDGWVTLDVVESFRTTFNGTANWFTLTRSGDRNQELTIGPGPALTDKLAEIDTKMPLNRSVVTGNVAVWDQATGTVKDSGILGSQVEQTTNKSSSVNSASETTYATSKAVKIVNDRLTSMVEGLGGLRGAVYNAFTSQGRGYTLTSLTVAQQGMGYREGDKFGVVGDVDAELTAHVDEDTGKVLSFTVDNGGMFSSGAVTIEVYPKSSTTAISDAQKVTVTDVRYDLVWYTTLRDIENPKLGDTVYVVYDELHNYERSLYTYRALTDVSNGWVYTSCVAAFPMINVCTLADGEPELLSDYPGDVAILTADEILERQSSYINS